MNEIAGPCAEKSKGIYLAGVGATVRERISILGRRTGNMCYFRCQFESNFVSDNAIETGTFDYSITYIAVEILKIGRVERNIAWK